MSSYIKLDRQILEWEWWHDINTHRLFTYMLLKANWKDGKFEGKVIPRGSFVSSIPSLSQGSNLTESEVRTAIKHLKKTGEVTVRTYSKYSVFTVNNYCQYQDDSRQITGKSQEDDRQVSDRQQSDDREIAVYSQSIDSQLTTIEEYKKERKEELKNERREESKSITVSKDTVCQTDVQRVIYEWNLLEAYGIKRISKISPDSKRYKNLNARIKQYCLDDVLDAIEKIKTSDFLQGKNSRGWVITFDWFVLPNNFPKVLEGNYDNRSMEVNNKDVNIYDKWMSLD